jgi:hypothetical protein
MLRVAHVIGLRQFLLRVAQDAFAVFLQPFAALVVFTSFRCTAFRGGSNAVLGLAACRTINNL